MLLPFDLPTTSLRYFVLVAQARSFRGASVKAHRSQPALSLAIKELEQRLGQWLFEPGNRTTLTPFGEACLPLAIDLLEHQRRTGEAFARLASHDTGRIALASVATAATHWLPDILADYVEMCPSVEVRLLDENSDHIERMVLAGEVDIGLCSPISNDPRLAFEVLLQDPYGLVCRSDHPLAKRRSIPWSALADLPIIGGVDQQLATHAQAELLTHHTIRVSHMMSLLAMLDRGLGVAVLPELGIPPNYTDRLRFIPLTRPHIERRIGIMKLAQRSLSPAAAMMEKLIQQRVAFR